MADTTQACAVLDGKVWSIVQKEVGPDYEEVDEDDTVVVNYNYHQSKQEATSGEQMTVESSSEQSESFKHDISKVDSAEDEMLPDKCVLDAGRRGSNDSGCMSNADSSTEEQSPELGQEKRNDENNNKIMPQFNNDPNISPAMRIAMRNAPTEAEEEVISSPNPDNRTEQKIIKINLRSKLDSKATKSTRSAKKIKEAKKISSLPCSDEYMTSQQTLRKVEPKYESSDGSDQSDDENDSNGKTTRMQFEQDGLIIKYKYYLSVKKDADGKPISWKSRGSGRIIPNDKISPGGASTNSETEKTKILKDDAEDIVILKYQYVSNQSEAKHQDISTTFGDKFEVKASETTIFSKDALSADDDIQRLVRSQDGRHESRSKSQSAETSHHKRPQNSTSSSGYGSLNRTSSYEDSVISYDVTHESIAEVFDEPVTRPTNEITKQTGRHSNKSLVKKTNKYSRRESDQDSSDEKKKIERITFKARCGLLPYTAVFRLDDSIDYLKTFMQLISGLPPNRQKYFAYDEDENDKKVQKRRKVRTLRQLGFHDGEVIHLDVKTN